VEPEFHPLPRIGDEEPRGAITATWRGCSVIATHLSLNRAARGAQIEALARMAGRLPPPVILMGDLNSGHLGLRPLRSVGLRPAPGWRPTVERGWPCRIDHVLSTSGVRLAGVRAYGGGASDHKAVAATIFIDRALAAGYRG
jgi:endonuclease/exonuclease/phosphatase family metal-dependent hydrolase